MISDECKSELPDACQMCSWSLKCDHDCHKVPPGTQAIHRCQECTDTPNPAKCEFEDFSKCPWNGMTCPRCGEGKIIHTKD